jgi:hypothetical protein
MGRSAALAVDEVDMFIVRNEVEAKVGSKVSALRDLTCLADRIDRVATDRSIEF